MSTVTKPRLTLKSIKTHQDISDETLCFSATVYFDGKKVGTVRNQGCGGCNFYNWNSREIGEKIEDWAKTQDLEYKFDLIDQIVDEIVEQHETSKWLKRKCKHQVLFRLKGDKKSEWRILVAEWGQPALEWITEKYGDKIETIANQQFYPV